MHIIPDLCSQGKCPFNLKGKSHRLETTLYVISLALHLLLPLEVDGIRAEGPHFGLLLLMHLCSLNGVLDFLLF